MIQAQTDTMIHELYEKLQLSVSDKTVRKAVLKFWYVYIKKFLHASEQEHPRCKGQKGNLERTYAGERRINNLVVLAESDVNTNMTKHYSRTKTDAQAVDSTPVNTLYSTTILSSIQLDGKIAHTIYQGRTTAERLQDI